MLGVFDRFDRFDAFEGRTTDVVGATGMGVGIRGVDA
jgi:hypothetical protein